MRHEAKSARAGDAVNRCRRGARLPRVDEADDRVNDEASGGAPAMEEGEARRGWSGGEEERREPAPGLAFDLDHGSRGGARYLLPDGAMQ